MAKTKELMTSKAYDELKWKIINGEIEPGQLYNEQNICDLINVGRSPVRSALSKLKHDRLIDIIPRKGMLIRAIPNKEIQEILQVRLSVEPLVAKLAARNATKEDISKLAALLDQSENADLSDRKMAMRIDHDFHIGMAESTGNTVLAEVVSFIKNRSSVFWFTNIVTNEKMKQVQKEHRQVLQAIIDRDEKKAMACMTNHICKLENTQI